MSGAAAAVGSGVYAVLLGLASGVLIGAIYCAMLWLSLQHMRVARWPVVWLLATALPRLGIPVAAFYWVMDGHWQRLVVSLAGFLAARFVIQQRLTLGRPVGVAPVPTKEAN